MKETHGPNARRGGLTLAQQCALGLTVVGCAGPQQVVSPRDKAAPEPCPYGSSDTMREFGIKTGDEFLVYIDGPESRGPGEKFLKEGDATAVLTETVGRIQKGTRFSGHLIFYADKVSARFTSFAIGSRIYPVCLQENLQAWPPDSKTPPGYTPVQGIVYLHQRGTFR